MAMKDDLKGWLSFSRMERMGIVVLSFLLLGVIGYRVYLSQLSVPPPVNVDPTQFQAEIAAFEKDTILDLNTATAPQLDRLKGIGPVLAQRIVDYRAEVGGYVSVEQVNEVKGIGDVKYDAIVPYLRVDSIKLHKIHVNTATQEEMEKHPYIGVGLAKAIIKRREKKGLFTTWDELKELRLMKDEKFKKLRPYLSLK